jgi:hypothetical protein
MSKLTEEDKQQLREIEEKGVELPFYVLHKGKLNGPFHNHYEARAALNLRAIRSKWVRYKQSDIDNFAKKMKGLRQ